MKVMLDPGAFCPTRAHDTDAGLDLYSQEDLIIQPHSGAALHTGVHVEIPHGSAGMLVSKSGLNVHSDITSTGLIDEGYTGGIVVKLYNHGDLPAYIKRGQKISQLVIVPVSYEPVWIVDKIGGGERGDNGFGSTGI